MIELKEHPKLRDEMLYFLKKMKKVGQLLSTSTVQPIVKNMIQTIALELIKPGCGRFTITRKWSKQFMKKMLDLLCDNHFCKQISTILICWRLHYGLWGCLFDENILHSIYTLVKNDHIRIHLVPNGGEKTWEPKGTKHVQMNIRFGI